MARYLSKEQYKNNRKNVPSPPPPPKSITTATLKDQYNYKLTRAATLRYTTRYADFFFRGGETRAKTRGACVWVMTVTLETIEPCLRYGDRYLTTTLATSFTPTGSPWDMSPWLPCDDPSPDSLSWLSLLSACVLGFKLKHLVEDRLSLCTKLSSVFILTDLSLSLEEVLMPELWLSRFNGFKSDAFLKKTSVGIGASFMVWFVFNLGRGTDARVMVKSFQRLQIWCFSKENFTRNRRVFHIACICCRIILYSWLLVNRNIVQPPKTLC